MLSRAQTTVFWPGLSRDIARIRETCQECWRISPSQPPAPPVEPLSPTRPFQAIAADFFALRGVGYLVIVDRFSGWPHIVASVSGAQGLAKALIGYFTTFGVPEELSTDGGPEFTARETTAFLKRWGVRHRLSSAYHPQSNGRAEVAVKAMKRLLASSTPDTGTMDTERVAGGLLQFRNTPDPETGLSPAQIVFGRSLRDLLPVSPSKPVFEHPWVHPVWRDTWACQEQALKMRFARQVHVLGRHARSLPPLTPGTIVLVQNQTGPHPTRWDRTGIVSEVRPHDQYLVRVHGSGRVTLRNRRYLRPIQALSPFENQRPAPPVPSPPPVTDDGADVPPPLEGTTTPDHHHDVVPGTCATPQSTPAAMQGAGAPETRTEPRSPVCHGPQVAPSPSTVPAPTPQDPVEDPGLRRSQRTRRRPRYLEDFSV